MASTKGVSMRENLRLIQYCAEFRPREEIGLIPKGLHLRGIYVLFKGEGNFRNVVYVGIAAKNSASIRSRLVAHGKDVRKKGWTHFSFYKVWPNITEQEIRELEGLFLQIYRKDEQAQEFNKIKRYDKLMKIRIKDFKKRRNDLINIEKNIRSFT